MPEVSLQIDPNQQRELEETLAGIAGGVGKATAAAINRTTTHTRAVSARKIKQHINLPIARIKQSISTRNKATPKHPVAVVRFSHKPVPLIDYKARDFKPNGVSVTERLDKGTQTFRHAFIATMPEGHTGVFEREQGTWHATTKGKWKGLKREKIKELFGASVEGTFARAPGILSQVMNDSGAFLAKQVSSQISRLMKRKAVDEDEGDE